MFIWQIKTNALKCQPLAGIRIAGINKMKFMTRLKDNPMDESARPTPRPIPTTVNADRKKKEKKANLDTQAVIGKKDPTAFDARNNNMHKKRWIRFAIVNQQASYLSWMLTELVVRSVVPKDFDQWLPLWEGYNAFYGRSGSSALDPRITKITWNRFLDENEPVFALVAESNGALLGLTHYLYHRSTTSIATVCYLQDLFTNAGVRGRGIGRALIEAVYQKASEAGSPRVYWLTHETNQIAMKLYDQVADRSGFIVYRKSF
jgi:GNAT superfamily N-acetyltransferase